MINANIFNNNPTLKLLIQQIQSQQNNPHKQTYDPQPFIIQTDNNTGNFPINQPTELINNNQPIIENTPVVAYDQKQTKFMSKSFTNHRSNSVINFPQNNGNITARKKNSSGNLQQQRNILTQQQNRNKSKGHNFRETIISSNIILTNKQKKSKSISNLGHNRQQAKKTGSSHKFRVSQVTKKDTNKDKQIRQNSKKSVSAFSFHSNQPIPDQIIKYIKKRQDVEIVQYFEEYKKQFYIKSKILHDYIESTDQPQKVRNIYLNQNDTHFRNGLQAIMLKLFRNGTIVAQSYTNLRQQAVEEIQKWVIGWIHRKIMYGKLQQDQQNQVLMVEDALKHLEDYRKFINSQDTSF